MGFKKNQSQVTLKSARFQSDFGTRVIDFLSPERGMVEVKNRASLSFERQLRDFAEYALEEGIEFTIVVREGTELTGELQRAVDQRIINIQTIEQLVRGN